jgi:hypothetical protein
MSPMDRKSSWRRSLGAMVGTGALIFTFGCSSGRDLTSVAAQTAVAAPAATPIVVGCEPHQRTMVRPAVVNGVAVSQIECVAAEQPMVAQPAVAQPAAPLPAVTPVAYRPISASQTVATQVPVSRGGLEDTELIRPSAPASVARPVPARQDVYRDERPVRQTRSVKKSAIIIGSSAGVGAGVGAAIGGKKGALIGAAISGGGAAIWDQMTRRRN